MACHHKVPPGHKKVGVKKKQMEPSSQVQSSTHLLLNMFSVCGSKECNTRIADKSLAAISLRSKRVFAQQETTRNTRLKKNIAQPDAPSGNIDGNTQATVEVDDPTQSDENTHLVNEGHAHLVGQNHTCNEENGYVQADDNMLNGGEADGNNQMPNEDVQIGQNDRWERGINMGHGLHRINRALRGKLQVVIPEGEIRPMAPLVAAKFATECNIIVRNYVPVYKHWKDYKKHQGLFKLFAGKHKAKFDINTSDPIVQNACAQMMKNAVRQQRHQLKKEHFDPFPLHLVTKTSPIRSITDKEWNELVEYWKNPRKMETCQKNKGNRSNVKYHQTTSSRSYKVHLENLGDKYNDQEPDALDLFKECHYSKKKKCFSSTVQEAITQMENKLSTATEGEEQISVTEVVAGVLAENTKKNMFIQNVGMQNSSRRSSVRSIEAQLEAEKRANSDLRSVVNTQREQLDMLSRQLQETEESRIKQQEEMKKRQAEMEEDMKKQADLDAKLQLLLTKFQLS